MGEFAFARDEDGERETVAVTVTGGSVALCCMNRHGKDAKPEFTDVFMSPPSARLLAVALLDAAEDAERGVE